MATHAPMARVPFAPIDNPRLQHLASAKNRQNGVLAQKSPLNGKAAPSLTSMKPSFASAKRPFDPSEYDDNDSENVDPALLFSPSKKSKSDGLDKAFKPFTFSLAPSTSMPPPSIVPSRLSTPTRANISSPRAPMTAPAGRSPKRKASATHKSRRTSAPFTRIDPPFASRHTSALPFSLDAALSGTFSNAAGRASGATIQDSMPKNWFFDVYEDSTEEVSATLMEHSTLTLDLSSDEESSGKEKDERGKENMPPADYDAVSASRPAAEPTVAAPRHVNKADIIRRKIVAVDDMDDGLRSPLSDLETEHFIAEGLSKDSQVIVDAPLEKSTSGPQLTDMGKLFATAVPFTSGIEQKPNTSVSAKTLYDMPVITAEGDVKGDIIVWEDSSSTSSLDTSGLIDEISNTPSKAAVSDENTTPVAIDAVS